MCEQEYIEKQVYKNNKELLAKLERVDVTGEADKGTIELLLANDLCRLSGPRPGIRYNNHTLTDKGRTVLVTLKANMRANLYNIL